MISGVFPIQSQTELAPGIFQMALYAPQMALEALPGQFVDLYCSEKDKLLPRPISLFDADPESGVLSLIYAVVGKGTDEFSTYDEADTIRVTGPLGHGIFLGVRSEPWILDVFTAYGEVLPSSDDGACGFKGTVVDRMQEYLVNADAKKRILYACGPIPMMRAIQPFADTQDIETWFSLEERMGCGFGACYGCPARIRTADGGTVLKRVCKEGPVFPGKDVVFS